MPAIGEDEAPFRETHSGGIEVGSADTEATNPPIIDCRISSRCAAWTHVTTELCPRVPLVEQRNCYIDLHSPPTLERHEAFVKAPEVSFGTLDTQPLKQVFLQPLLTGRTEGVIRDGRPPTFVSRRSVERGSCGEILEER
jgi:hypothetical protein